MTVLAETKSYTPDDLLKMPDRDLYELVDGQLVEHTMSFWSSYVAGELLALLREFSRPKKLGWVVPEGTSYQCFPEAPAKVRKADVSFIAASRMSLAVATSEGHVSIAPNLAVEVISPNDLAYEVDAKVEDFLGAGVQLVWVVNPQVRTVKIHRPQGPGTILHENDILDGEDVLPGFRCRVGDLFQPPPGIEAS